MLKPGDSAPSFSLTNQFGEVVSDVDLRDRPALLVFFPLAFTPVCEGELSALAAAQAGLEGLGARVVGLSVDHRYALRDAADRLGVGFDLLSDFWPHGAVARAFGCFDEQRGHATRATFLVHDGVIASVVTAGANAARDVAHYQRAIAALRRG